MHWTDQVRKKFLNNTALQVIYALFNPGSMFKNLRRITDRQFWADCVLATAFIFALIFFGGGIFNAFEVLNPIGEAISDMDVTDIVFSKLRKDPDAHLNEDIVIVNIGNLNREGIAKQLEIIQEHHPRSSEWMLFSESLKTPGRTAYWQGPWQRSKTWYWLPS